MNYLTIKEEALFSHLNFYTWYRSLVETKGANYDEIMSPIKVAGLKKIFDEFDYAYKYSSIDKSFFIQTRFDGVDYNCLFELVHGGVNCRFWQKNLSSKAKIGHSLYFVCKHFYVAETGDDPDNIPFTPLWFRSLEHLAELLEEVFTMYERYKVASYEIGFWD